jgi:lipopolysaccharide transport system ATP-binding protein
VHGRVGSLLEVGTGFHPELTGRENIYLNGSILGLKKQEIEQKFDDIIKFSEIEKFLDTPVKRYSSGMYVRLAFAIAAHLEPEILIIDEVLAVGDAHFQKKCLGKMGEVAKEGWTVLFVSHNMNAVEQLCSKCLSLDNGKIKEYASDVRGVINDYLFNEKDNARKCEWVNSGNEYPNPWFQPLKFSLTDENGKTIDSAVNNNDEIFINIKGKIEQVDPYLTIGYAIYSNDGNLLYWSYQTDSAEQDWHELKRGINILKSCIPKKFLNEGSYRIELIGGLHFREWLFQPGHTIPVIFLTIQGGLSDSPYWIIKRPGLLAPVIGWGVEYENV